MGWIELKTTAQLLGLVAIWPVRTTANIIRRFIQRKPQLPPKSDREFFDRFKNDNKRSQ